jgi:cytochrome c nitrite reductase small subunit
MFGKKTMSKQKKVLFLLACFGLLGVTFYTGIELTCTPWFCTSCHEMKTLGDSWKLSKHGPSNPKTHNCMKCHAQPGAVGFVKAKINGLFSLVYHFSGNYHIEATQPVVCLRGGCHQMEEMDRAFRPDQTAKLNHANHINVMKKIGTRHQCMPCHRNIAHGQETYLPDMKKDCFVCHTDNYQEICSTNCNSCHSASHQKVRLAGQELPLLDLHNDAEVSCTECHEETQAAMKASCEGCHEDENYESEITSEKEARK